MKIEANTTDIHFACANYGQKIFTGAAKATPETAYPACATSITVAPAMKPQAAPALRAHNLRTTPKSAAVKFPGARIAACLTLILVSCSQQRDLILGDWEDIDGTPLTISFSADRTARVLDATKEYKYRFPAKNRIEMEAEGQTMSFTFAASHGRLTLREFKSEFRLTGFKDGRIVWSLPPGDESAKARSEIQFRRRVPKS